MRDLALRCGAVPVDIDARAHDESVALLSHLPQIVASALAGQLVEASRVERLLSGPGLVDTTRLAASDPQLWTEIVRLNGHYVVPAVRALAAELVALADEVEGRKYVGINDHDGSNDDDGSNDHGDHGDQGDHGDGRVQASDRDDSETRDAQIAAFFVRGNRGRALIPVKRGEVSGAFGRVRVSVADQPGVLAALLSAAGAAGVNVEDVHVEHLPGRPQGVIELVVDVAAVSFLRESLRGLGWSTLGDDEPDAPQLIDKKT